jgi:hypothetical protein
MGNSERHDDNSWCLMRVSCGLGPLIGSAPTCQGNGCIGCTKHCSCEKRMNAETGPHLCQLAQLRSLVCCCLRCWFWCRWRTSIRFQRMPIIARYASSCIRRRRLLRLLQPSSARRLLRRYQYRWCILLFDRGIARFSIGPLPPKPETAPTDRTLSCICGRALASQTFLEVFPCRCFAASYLVFDYSQSSRYFAP